MICHICKAEILNHSVQQMIKKHGRVFPAHFNCGTAWCCELIDVYEINHDGSGYLDIDPISAIDMIKDSDVGSKYIITKHKMNQQQYYNLKEFEGF